MVNSSPLNHLRRFETIGSLLITAGAMVKSKCHRLEEKKLLVFSGQQSLGEFFFSTCIDLVFLHMANILLL